MARSEFDRVYYGDNLSIMRGLLAEGRQHELIYADPPFCTQRDFTLQGTGEFAYSDKWPNREAYDHALRERLAVMRDLLTPDGCLVLHCDQRTQYTSKPMLDDIFGPDCFASEIIWRYRRWPTKTPNFQRVHDVLLRYVRDPAAKPRFTQLYEPLAPSTLATWGTKKQLAVVDSKGRRRRSSATSEASPGVPLGDVWSIGIVAPVSHERTRYPTQKPEALLSRLVESLTLPGDRVLDPYCGSGTTLAVCARLGRVATGIDSSAVAMRCVKARLTSVSSTR